MKIAKKKLLEILWETTEDIVRNEATDTSRWSIHYDFVFKMDGKLYQTSYSVGATEQQDEGPWEHDGDEIECYEVEAYEKTVTDYRKVK